MTTVGSAAIKALRRSSADRWSPHSLSAHERESVKPRLEHFNLLWLLSPHTTALTHSTFLMVSSGEQWEAENNNLCFTLARNRVRSSRPWEFFLSCFEMNNKMWRQIASIHYCGSSNRLLKKFPLEQHICCPPFFCWARQVIFTSQGGRVNEIYEGFLFSDPRKFQTHLGKLSRVKLQAGSCSRRVGATVAEDSSDLDARFLIKRIFCAACCPLSGVYFSQGGVSLLLMDQ